MIADCLTALFSPPSAVRSWDRLDPKDPVLAKMFGLGTNVRSKVVVNGDTVLGIPAVLRGVDIISNALMKAKPSIFKRVPNGGDDDSERDKAHPSWKVVHRRANQFMSAGYFRKTLTAWSILRGNGLGYIVRRGNREIVEMLPLLPDRSGMAIFRDGQKHPGDAEVQEGDEVYYWTIVGGKLRKIVPDNVIHIKGLSHNGYWGIDIVDALSESFGLSIAPRDFSAAFYGQGATPSGIVFAPTGLKESAQADFAKKVREANEGLGRSHRLMILEETAKYQQLTIDPEKAALIATREFERVEIANIIGIQAHKLGDSSRVAYNSLEQSNQEHLDDDLDPRLQTWEDEYGEKCLTEEEKDGDTHYVKFNRKALVRVNLAARTARHQFERQNGISTANDILRQEDQRPIGEVGDTYMVPANMTVLTADGLPIIKGQVPENGTSPEPVPAEEDDSESAFHELAMFEVERVTTRACREAGEAARGGAGKFVEWLDRLPSWAKKPAAIAPMLGAALGHIHQELDAFTKPPHTAASLAENVARSIEAIQAGAVAQAREQLEAHA